MHIMTVDEIGTRLLEAGVANVPSYLTKLAGSRRSAPVYWDVAAEASAALMFRSAGFSVRMRDAPDLRLELCGNQLFAEVKHFRRKAQDDLDDERLSNAHEMLVPYGDTSVLEGSLPWEQIASVARRKSSQYQADVPNILVLDSSSPNCVEDLDVLTAVHVIDEYVGVQPDDELAKLNGILLISQMYNISRRRNVYFFETLSQGLR